MSFNCKIRYYRKDDEDQRELTEEFEVEEDTEKSAESVLRAYDPNLVFVSAKDFEEIYYKCTVEYADCCGHGMIADIEVPVKDDDYVARYLYENEYPIDTAYAWDVTWEEDKLLAEQLAEAEEAKKIKVEWHDLDDVLSLFHRCVETLSGNFDFSLKKLKREVKENLVERVMES